MIKNIIKIIKSNIIYRKIKYLRQMIKKRIPLKKLQFQMHIVDHCNLNCKGCGHFSPIAQTKYLDIEKFEKDMKQLADITNKNIARIDLLGGEPLLHPKIIEICNITRRYTNGTIRIFTNGILLSKQPKEFWESCYKNNISIVISYYPININYDKVKKIANTYQVELIYNYKGPSERPWFKPTIDFEGKQNKNKSFSRCSDANDCITFEDGKIATCGRPFHIKHFNAFFNKNIQIHNEDCYDIYKIKSHKELMRLLAKPIPFCRYCNRDATIITNWETSKRSINEWM